MVFSNPGQYHDHRDSDGSLSCGQGVHRSRRRMAAAVGRGLSGRTGAEQKHVNDLVPGEKSPSSSFLSPRRGRQETATHEASQIAPDQVGVQGLVEDEVGMVQD